MPFSFFRTFTIKGITAVAVIIPIIVLIAGCEEEKAEPRTYPRLVTLPVTDISESGAVFHGKIYSAGTEPVSEYGFVWSNFMDPNYNSSNKSIIVDTRAKGEFSAEIFTTLETGKVYRVKAFVKTDEHIVYGPKVTFTSMGSGCPEVTGFKPLSAGWNDTIFINGKNFSWVLTDNIVKLNDLECRVVFATDTTIKAIVNTALKDTLAVLSLAVTGKSYIFLKDTLCLIQPVIEDFYPRSARWNEAVQLRVNKYMSFTNISDYINLGSFRCSNPGFINDTTLWIRVPYEIEEEYSIISGKYNSFTIRHSTPFQLQAPEFTFSPQTGVSGNIISLSGNFNAISARNSVYFGDKQASILSSSSTTIKVRVPSGISDVFTDIVYKATPFSVVSAEQFHAKTQPYILFNELTFPSQFTWTNSWNPNNRDVSVSFAVNGMGYMMDYYSGRMYSFDPATYTFTDLGVHSRFTGIANRATVINRDTAYIVSGPVGLNRYDPETNTWLNLGSTPTTQRGGIAFSINGQIYFGLTTNGNLDRRFWKYDVTTKTWSQRKDMQFITSFSPIGSFTIGGKGYVLFYDNRLCEYDPVADKWTEVSLYPNQSSTIDGRSFFVSGNRAFIGLGTNSLSYWDAISKEFWVYDPATNDWSYVSTTMPKGPRSYAVSFTIGDKAYIGLGYDYSLFRDFYEITLFYPSQ